MNGQAAATIATVNSFSSSPGPSEDADKSGGEASIPPS